MPKARNRRLQIVVYKKGNRLLFLPASAKYGEKYSADTETKLRFCKCILKMMMLVVFMVNKIERNLAYWKNEQNKYNCPSAEVTALSTSENSL